MIVGSGYLSRRKSHHFFLLRKGKHDNKYFQNAVNKDGIENFVFEVIEECEHSLCVDLEGYWVNMLGTMNPDLGYNLLFPCKSPMLGRKMPQEYKDMCRQRMLGFKMSEETKQKISKTNIGHRHSNETKKKMSESKKGYKQSPEHQRKLAISRAATIAKRKT